MRRFFVSVVVLCMLVPGALLQAQTVVSKRDIKPVLNYDAVLLAKEQTEHKLDFSVYDKSMDVTDVLAHGSQVKKGDVLLRVNTDELQLALDAAVLRLRSAERAMLKAQLELSQLKTNDAFKMDKLNEDLKEAKRDLDYFKTVERNLDKEKREFSMASQIARLEETKEEFEQLKKMYKESDLAVDTQEIVLNRTRRRIKSMEMSLRHSKISMKKFLEVTQPEELKDKERDVAKATAKLDQYGKNSVLAIEGKADAVVKATAKAVAAKKHLTDLQADLKAATIVADRNGTLMHGLAEGLAEQHKQFNKGKGASRLDKGIEEGDTVKPGNVLMTVVAAKQYQALIAVPVKFAYLVTDKVAVSCSLVVAPDESLSGVLSDSAYYFDGEAGQQLQWYALSFQSDTNYRLGMGVEVKLVGAEVKDLLTVERSVIQYNRKGRAYCALSSGKDKFVELGLSDGVYVQILSGLNEGDKLKRVGN